MANQNPALDHANLIATLLVGYTVGTNIFVDKKPESPDVVVSVFNTKGYPALEVADKPGVRRPGLMVHVRGKPSDYVGPFQVVSTIFLVLCKRARYTANGNMYKQIVSVGDVGQVEYDPQNRPNWYINFDVMM